MIQNISAIRFANNILRLNGTIAISTISKLLLAKPRCRRSRGYYDHSGALKDMVQNHILQVVALLAMEPPVAFSKKKSVQKDQSIESYPHL